MRTRTLFASLVATFVIAAAPIPASADILNVPGDYPTIQGAIDAAPEGAVIYVAAGVYNENIDFLGKALIVEGTGPDSIIHGGGNGPVVRFVNGESDYSTIDSFTITGGLSATGGGVEIRNSSPTVLRNHIVGNSAASVGSGIFVTGISAAPQILNNLMAFNTGVDGGDPHTIQVAGASPRIVNNTIMRNDSNAILTVGSGTPEIRNNILARNGSRTVGGGTRGRGICDFAPGTITQYNLFFRNTIAALLTSGTDFRRIREAEETLATVRLSGNIDAAPRFSGGNAPRSIENATRDRFIPRADSNRASRAIGAGDPSAAYNNVDGTRNTIGFTGGPHAQTF